MHKIQNIIKSLRDNLQKNPQSVADALKRLTLVSSKTPEYSFGDTLSIAMQAKKNNIEISDLKTHSNWSQEDQSNKINPNAVPITLTSESIDKNGVNILIPKETLYDVSQTNVDTILNIPTHPSLRGSEQINIQLFQEIQNELKNQNPEIIYNFADDYNYFPYVKTIQIAKGDTLENQLTFMIKQTIIENLKGEAFRTFKSKLSEIPFEEAVSSLATLATLDRLNIKSEIPIDLENLSFNIGGLLEAADQETKKISKNLKLDEIISKELIRSNPSLEDNYNAQQIKKFNNNKRKSTPEDYKKRYPDAPVFEKLTEDEMKKLNNKTKEAISASDPLPVLNALNVELIEKSGRYKILNIAGENTKSCEFLTKGSNWYFNRFGGANEAGDIIKFAMIHANLDYKEAIELCRETLNIKDYFEEAVDTRKDEFKLARDNYFKNRTNKKQPSKNTNINVKPIDEKKSQKKSSLEAILKKADETTKLLKEKNTVTAALAPTSWLHSATNKISTASANYMRSRGLPEISPEALDLTIAYIKDINGKETIKYRSGIGLITGDYENAKLIHDALKSRDTVLISDLLPNEKEEPTIGGDVKFKPIIFKDTKDVLFNPEIHDLTIDNNKESILHSDGTTTPLKNGPKGQYYTVETESKFKTQTGGNGGHTTLPNDNIQNIKSANIFEGYTDQEAAANSRDNHGSRLVLNDNNNLTMVANSVANADRMNKEIHKRKLNHLKIYSQNDPAAILFLDKLLKDYRGGLEVLNYTPKEYKEDINDLTVESPNLILDTRFKKYQTKKSAVEDLIKNQAQALEIDMKDINNIKPTDTKEQLELKKTIPKLSFSLEQQASMFETLK